jgi:predicted glycosyltransferase
MEVVSASMVSAPTVLFQAPNRIGLGHLNRLASIAIALQSVWPGIRTPFVIEGSSHQFLERFALPFLTIPNAVELARSPEWAAWPESERQELATRLADAILESWKPQLVVYDCLPGLHFSNAVRRKGIPTAFCVRQVKNFHSYASNQNVKIAISDAKVLIVPHCATTFSLPEHLRQKTVYVGNVAHPASASAAKSPWTTDAGQRMVIITGGGGGYPRTVEFYNLALRSLATIMNARDDLYVLLVTGPLFQDWSRLLLSGRMHVCPFAPGLDDLFSQAALVISQAGYNSMVELAVSGVPTICVPQPRPLDDQFERAELFSRENHNFMIYKGTNSDELAKLIIQCLEESDTRRNADASLEANGAYLAAKVLKHLVEQHLDRRSLSGSSQGCELHA